MPVTIYDVARQAGVSIATVSRVLRGSAPVQDGTRQRVEHAVDELGFVPSRLGVSLAERRHAANGVVFPDLSGPYFAEVVLGYEEVTSRLGRSVLILSTHEQADPETTVRELTSRVDGLAIFDATVGEGTVRSTCARPWPATAARTRPSGGPSGGSTRGCPTRWPSRCTRPRSWPRGCARPPAGSTPSPGGSPPTTSRSWGGRAACCTAGSGC